MYIATLRPNFKYKCGMLLRKLKLFWLVSYIVSEYQCDDRHNCSGLNFIIYNYATLLKIVHNSETSVHKHSATISNS